MMSSSSVETAMVETLRLRPGVVVAYDDQERAYLGSVTHAQDLGKLGPGPRTALGLLAGGSWTPTRLRHAACNGRGPEAAALDEFLTTLKHGGWVSITVWSGPRALYSLEPVRSAPERPDESEAPPDLALSRFAVVYRGDDALVACSPSGWCELHIHDASVVAVLHALAGGEAPAGGQGYGAEELSRLLTDLRWADLVLDTKDEESQLRSRQWGVHELWFHERSRAGRWRWTSGYGRTLWAEGRFPPPTERRPPFPGPALPLARPDLDVSSAADPPLTAVLEQRRSRRAHDNHRPLSRDQLAEFLYRTVGVRERHEPGPSPARPYPSAGGRYELEVYPVVDLVEGLDRGLYHYDAARHVLEPVCEYTSVVRRLTEQARAAAGLEGRPQVLLVVAARFGRVMWTYEAMAYAAILKDVGVVYQTMYLVATAMSLAGCALGGGSSDDFAEAAGLDPLVESSVGEFILGTAGDEA